MFRLLLLGNGWADCVEIWYVLGVPLVTACAVVTGGVSLHVRTCTPRFCISGTARPIVFKFGVWVGGHSLSAFHKSCVGCIRTCAPLFRISGTKELYKIYPRKTGTCDGRESNPGQLLGRQLCSPLYHHRLRQPDSETATLALHGGRKRPHGWPMVISEFLRFVGVNALQISKLKRHDQ